MRRWAWLLAFGLTLVGTSALGRTPRDESPRGQIDNDDIRSASPENSSDKDSLRIAQKREWDEEWITRPRMRAIPKSADGELVPEPSAVVLFGTGFLIAQKALRRPRR